MDTLNKEIGALTAAMGNIERELTEARESRRRVYEKLEGMERRLDRIEFRQENTEKALGVMSPTVTEFSTMKMQAQGAGKLGAFLWRLAGLSMAAAAGAATMWGSLTQHLPWR